MATSNFVIEYGMTVGSTEVITSAGKLSASALSTLTADNLTEGSTNLFYTNARARAALSAAGGGDLAYNNSTGVFTLATVNGGTF
tara:strand:+ start:1006 stop:1260 length:255 start_codon:yes stop_codon:yes gene_type:complete